MLSIKDRLELAADLLRRLGVPVNHVTVAIAEEALLKLGAAARRVKRCPECDAAMVKEEGCIGEVVASRLREDHEPRRVVRPATFWSCYACGHCEEVSGAARTGA